MKVLKSAFVLIGGIAAWFLPMASAPAWAQQAFSVPVSNEVIEGWLEIPGLDEKVFFMAREGSMIKVRDLAHSGSYYQGLVPRRSTEIADGINFWIFNITQTPDGEIVEEVATPLSFSAAGTSESLASTGVQVKFLGGRDRTFQQNFVLGLDPSSPEDQQSLTAYGQQGAGICCIGSGSVRVCSGYLAIKGSGYCCEGEFCGFRPAFK